jgi:hypothetical protein
VRAVGHPGEHYADWNVKGNVGKLRPTIGPRVTGVGPGYQRFVAKKEPYMQR